MVVSTGRDPRTRGMVHVPDGRFAMGDDRFYPEETPVVERAVETFWLDEHPVTNAEFRRFVKDTGHVTVAEAAPARADFPDADADGDLVPGSLVFAGTSGPVPLDDWTRWWAWVPGADWRHPAGRGSSLQGRDRHPVVHVALEDAHSYAEWAGKRLPTEVEWEYAARGGLESAVFAWGDDVMPRGRTMANTWQGRFPWERLSPHSATGTSPVGRFAPNGYGLADMTGNVWEWTASPWSTDHRGLISGDVGSAPAEVHSCCTPARAPLAETDRYVIKGGSHLCAPSYCLRYRPAARQGQAVRSSTGHIGFRCAMSA